MVILCPCCRAPSDRVKCVRLPAVAFLFVAGGYEIRNEFGCPKCARSKMLWNGVINLLTANVLWPIAILPTMIAGLLQCSRPGHSKQVLAALSPPTAPPQFRAREERAEPRRNEHEPRTDTGPQEPPNESGLPSDFAERYRKPFPPNP